MNDLYLEMCCFTKTQIMKHEQNKLHNLQSHFLLQNVASNNDFMVIFTVQKNCWISSSTRTKFMY